MCVAVRGNHLNEMHNLLLCGGVYYLYPSGVAGGNDTTRTNESPRNIAKESVI